MPLFQRPDHAIWKICAALLLIFILLFLAPLFSAPVRAQGPTNAECLACHSDPNLSMTLPSGEPLSLFVDAQHFASSLHSQNNVTCVQCHTDITGYPHPEFKAQDRRAVTLMLYQQCTTCHEQAATQTKDGIHAHLLAEGNRNAAVCTDCHTAHEVTDPATPRTQIPNTCAQCHSTIAEEYSTSVHGAALFDDNNPDVPTCVNCHGVHQIQDPRTAAFRLRSPQICAECHTNKQMMDKYGLSTDVLNTYVADFHGTTVQLFAKQSPDAATNKPVCYDCHGIHNIKRVDDPESTVFGQNNLLITCQQCHPDATTDSFTAAWMGHYSASPERYPMVYYVNLFYWILIPTTVIGMVAFIGTDLFRRVRTRIRGNKG